MSKIATELEAKTMGGGTLSVIDNKCCTKARALELGCQIKSGFSYTDNQLVELVGLEGIGATIPGPNVILHYSWQNMPINNIQQFRVRFLFVNESSVNGEPFKYSDNTTYFTITPRLVQGEQTYTKTLANPLEYYLKKLAPSNQDPYNTPVWIRFEGYMMLRQVPQITLTVNSQSENWGEVVTFPSSGRWVIMNNFGRVYRFTGGEIDLNIELYTAPA